MTITEQLDENGAEKLAGRIGWSYSSRHLARLWVAQQH